jgi:hypothetical protein
MSFQARRLRVQLPCGEATLIEEAVHQLCRYPTAACHYPTQFCLCTYLTPCHFNTTVCHRFITCVEFNSGVCNFGSGCGPLASLCAIPSACAASVGCPGGSEQPIDPGTIVVDPEDLPVLREALEAQLREIDKAEQLLRERGSESD